MKTAVSLFRECVSLTLTVGFARVLVCSADDIKMFGVSNRWVLVGASMQQYWAETKRLRVFMLSSDICKDICCVHAHAHRR